MTAIDRLRQMESSATATPWYVLYSLDTPPMCDVLSENDGEVVSQRMRMADAELIVLMRNLLPTLLALAENAERLRTAAIHVLQELPAPRVEISLSYEELVAAIDAFDETDRALARLDGEGGDQ